MFPSYKSVQFRKLFLRVPKLFWILIKILCALWWTLLDDNSYRIWILLYNFHTLNTGLPQSIPKITIRDSFTFKIEHYRYFEYKLDTNSYSIIIAHRKHVIAVKIKNNLTLIYKYIKQEQNSIWLQTIFCKFVNILKAVVNISKLLEGNSTLYPLSWGVKDN